MIHWVGIRVGIVVAVTTAIGLIFTLASLGEFPRIEVSIVAVGAMLLIVYVDFARWWYRPRPPAEPAPGLVYDVLDDRPLRPVDILAFGLFGLAVFIWLFITLRFSLQPPSGWYWYHGLALGVGGLLVWVLMFLMWTPFLGAIVFVRDQGRCKIWRKSGQCSTTEGNVSGCRIEQPGHRGQWDLSEWVDFQIGDESFTVGPFRPPQGGFRLDAVQGTTGAPFLADGVKLRLLHRDNRILRIEVMGYEVPLPPPPSHDKVRNGCDISSDGSSGLTVHEG